MYLGYYTVIEGSWWGLYETLQEAKEPWCFGVAVFDVGDLTKEDINKWPKPMLKQVIDIYPLVHKDGALLQELDGVECVNEQKD